MKFLIHVDTDTEACVLQGLLEACDIPCRLDYDSGDESIKVILGNSNLGVNVYVTDEDYDEAFAIIHTPPELV